MLTGHIFDKCSEIASIALHFDQLLQRCLNITDVSFVHHSFVQLCIRKILLRYLTEIHNVSCHGLGIPGNGCTIM